MATETTSQSPSIIVGEEEVRSRRVHFDTLEPSVWVDPCEISEDEIRAYWFRRPDFASFERERRTTVRALKRAGGDMGKLDSSLVCFRGMEELINSDFSRRLKKQRRNSQSEVMQEQDRQKQYGITDPTGLRKVSEAVSAWARNHALELGRHDARVAATGKDEAIPLGMTQRGRNDGEGKEVSKTTDNEEIMLPFKEYAQSRRDSIARRKSRGVAAMSA